MGIIRVAAGAKVGKEIGEKTGHEGRAAVAGAVLASNTTADANKIIPRK